VTGDIPAAPGLEDILLAPGGRVLFKVRDNGQGANAPADEGHLAILINPGGTLTCGIVPADSFFWEFFFANVPVDNPPSEQIVVK